MTHTPERMKVHNPDVNTLSVLNKEGQSIVEWPANYSTHDIALAHLMASAPDLLEALASFMFEFGDKADSATVRKGRAAIARATGAA